MTNPTQSIPCVLLVLIAGCVVGEKAAHTRYTGPFLTFSGSQGSDLYKEDYLFAQIFNRADLVLESVDANVITLKRPKYVHWMPISELNTMLAGPGLRKEVAVVVIGQWPGPLDSQWSVNSESASSFRPKTMDEFAFEMDQKLRKAGFKQVVFASKYNGSYRRAWLGRPPTKEEAQKEMAFWTSYLTNRPPPAPGK